MGEGRPFAQRLPDRSTIGAPLPSGSQEIDGADIPPPARAAGAAPIVVTGTMGAADQRWFDGLRARHFPPERNFVAAHITLFHQLPPSALDELERMIRAIASDTPPPAAHVREVYSLGRGVAFRIESPALLAARARIAYRFSGMLSEQDRGTPRLHITVQNKVTPAAARALLDELARDFRPRPIAIVGLAAHRYRGGPWELAFARNFRGPRARY